MSILIIDERISGEIRESLSAMGHTPFLLPRDEAVGEAVKSHPDTLLFCLEGNLVTTRRYREANKAFFDKLETFCFDLKIILSERERSSKYPHDCITNALVVGRRIFCKTDSIAKEIPELAERLGYEICPVKQGYPACTALTFGNSAITADEGLARAMSAKGISVTLISQGRISLPPHEYGFIGGASFVLGNTVYFFGNISLHPDCDRIVKAIKAEGYSFVSLSGDGLRDFGGAVVL